jgi:hypothetical protein
VYFDDVDSLSDSSSTSKKQVPRVYLEQLKASIECDRRINSLISFYNELEKKAVSLQTRITALKLKN